MVFFQGNLVGMVGFNKIDFYTKEAEIGYWLDFQFCGKRLVTNSVRALIKYGEDEFSLRTFIVNIEAGNQKNIAVARRLGFSCQGESKRLKTAEKIKYTYITRQLFCGV